jgi:hypothetical protein
MGSVSFKTDNKSGDIISGQPVLYLFIVPAFLKAVENDQELLS